MASVTEKTWSGSRGNKERGGPHSSAKKTSGQCGAGGSFPLWKNALALPSPWQDLALKSILQHESSFTWPEIFIEHLLYARHLAGLADIHRIHSILYRERPWSSRPDPPLASLALPNLSRSLWTLLGLVPPSSSSKRVISLWRVEP